MPPHNLNIRKATLQDCAVILHHRWRVRKRLRALPRRPVTAREIPAGHPDEGYVLSISDGLIWTELMAKEHA